MNTKKRMFEHMETLHFWYRSFHGDVCSLVPRTSFARMQGSMIKTRIQKGVRVKIINFVS